MQMQDHNNPKLNSIIKELLKWQYSSKIIGLYGSFTSGEDDVFKLLEGELLQYYNQSELICISPQSCLFDDCCNSPWTREVFFLDTVRKLEAKPRVVIVNNDVWKVLDVDRSLIVWTLLDAICLQQGMAYVADADLHRLRPWCDMIYEISTNGLEMNQIATTPTGVPFEFSNQFYKTLYSLISGDGE